MADCIGLENRCSHDASCSESRTSKTAGNDLASCLALLAEKSADLALVAERWDGLPEAIRAGIMAMVKTAAREAR